MTNYYTTSALIVHRMLRLNEFFPHFFQVYASEIALNARKCSERISEANCAGIPA